MKYQIYLNKDTTAFIEKIAERTGRKPASVIKELIESFYILGKPVEEKIAGELNNAKPRKV